MIKPQHLRWMVFATIAFWLWRLGLQIYSVIFQLDHPEFLNDPQIGNFTQRYLLTSSIQTVFYVCAGIGFSWLVLIRKAWAAIALAILAAWVLWKTELSAWSIYFRPPLGDGSFGGAFVGWGKLHRSSLRSAFDLLNIVFLAASIPFWCFAYDTIGENRQNSKA